MTQEQMTTLAANYQADEEFKAALVAATSTEDAVRIAADHGYPISVDDLARAAKTGQDLSDDELEAQAGGWTRWPTPTEVCNVVSLSMYCSP